MQNSRSCAGTNPQDGSSNTPALCRVEPLLQKLGVGVRFVGRRLRIQVGLGSTITDRDGRSQSADGEEVDEVEKLHLEELILVGW